MRDPTRVSHNFFGAPWTSPHTRLLPDCLESYATHFIDCCGVRWPLRAGATSVCTLNVTDHCTCRKSLESIISTSSRFSNRIDGTCTRLGYLLIGGNSSSFL